MTLRIERTSDGHSTTIRLIGRMRAEHLEELQAQIESSGPKLALDLDEVNLVGLEVVRFLADCQLKGIELLRCSTYIADWIVREQGEAH